MEDQIPYRRKIPEIILVEEKIGHLEKLGHFSMTKFYASQVSQKALFIPLKFYLKNKKNN